MATDRLINYDQGTSMIEALGTIANNIESVGSVSLETLGMGYTTCSTATATAAKTATLTGYDLKDGGLISVKFTNAVNSGATLNINSKGAKSIYYKGSALTNGIITAGCIATFLYSNNQYNLVNIDNLAGRVTANETNISMLEQLGVAKNYAQLTYTGSTVNNVTYTVSNGVISTNGNTTNASTNITITGEIPLSAGDYVLLDGLTTSSAQINLTLRINNVWKGTTATGGKYEFTVEQGDTVHIELIVANNQSTAGVVFKPMIISKAVYDAGFTDFQPYTMSLSDITAWILAQS